MERTSEKWGEMNLWQNVSVCLLVFFQMIQTSEPSLFTVIRKKVSGPLSEETGNKSPLLLPVSKPQINSVGCKLVNTVMMKHAMLISIPSVWIH